MCTGIKSLLKNYPKAVYESLLGNALNNKNLVVLQDHCIIMRRDHRFMKGTVKLIGGGGAGTDPAEAYYVGKGMLTAAVVGDWFTAPCVNEILTAIRELSIENPDGILLLVKNYIGDKINFGLALDKALTEGISVKMLLIGDNAFESVLDKHGKKGFAGAAMVYKIAGEMAEEGKSMEDIIEECRRNIIHNLATVSVTYSSWNNVVVNPLGRLIGPQEIVFGIEVYGSGGAKKIKRTDLKSTVSLVLREILWALQLNPDFEYEVILLINNLGALSKVEEAVICKEVCEQLRELQVSVVELLVGTFMASKNPEGFSISILKLNSKDTVRFLKAPTTAPGWHKTLFEDLSEILPTDSPTVLPLMDHEKLNKAKFENVSFGPCFSKKATVALKQILVFASEALISCEKQLNVIDSETGSGDIGTILKRGAEALKEVVLNNEMDLTSPGILLFQLSEISCQFIGGLIGGLNSVFYCAASEIYQNAKEISPETCVKAIKAGAKAVQHYGLADLGERTVLDVLFPTSDTFELAIMNGKTFSEAVNLAVTTCEYKSEETKTMKSPVLKRLNVDQPLIYADSWCHSVTIWLRALYEGLKLHYPSECD